MAGEVGLLLLLLLLALVVWGLLAVVDGVVFCAGVVACGWVVVGATDVDAAADEVVTALEVDVGWVGVAEEEGASVVSAEVGKIPWRRCRPLALFCSSS